MHNWRCNSLPQRLAKFIAQPNELQRPEEQSEEVVQHRRSPCECC